MQSLCTKKSVISEVDTGQVRTKFTESKKREDFRAFLDDVLADQPHDKEIHVIVDNYSPHKRNDDWLAKFEGRVQFHFTPTSDITSAPSPSVGGSAQSKAASSAKLL